MTEKVKNSVLFLVYALLNIIVSIAGMFVGYNIATYLSRTQGIRISTSLAIGIAAAGITFAICFGMDWLLIRFLKSDITNRKFVNKFVFVMNIVVITISILTAISTTSTSVFVQNQMNINRNALTYGYTVKNANEVKLMYDTRNNYGNKIMFLDEKGSVQSISLDKNAIVEGTNNIKPNCTISVYYPATEITPKNYTERWRKYDEKHHIKQTVMNSHENMVGVEKIIIE